MRGQLEEVVLIDALDCLPYLEEAEMEKTFSVLEEEVTQEAGDEYVQAFIMVLHGNTFAQGTVVSHKHNAEDNVIGHANENPILDSCLYDIEIANGKVTAPTANVIAKTMYAQCVPDENEYIFLDKLIDTKCTMMPFPLTNNRLLSMALPNNIGLQRDDSFVADGRMAPPPGKSCPTSKSLTPSRLSSFLPT